MLKNSVVSELFKRHYSDLRNIISSKFNKCHYDAEDIIQDAFQKIIQMDNVEEIENPKAYLFQAAHNLALNRIRKRKHHLNYISSQDADAIEERTPERSILAGRDLIALEEALSELPEKYQKTFILSRVKYKSYNEISLQLGIPKSTVEKHIIKTLKYLKDHLKEEVES